MNLLAFAARFHGKNSRLPICAAALLLFCGDVHAQAATYTVGGAISNLLGSGLVLRLDGQAGCIASGNITSVTNSPAAGGAEQCLTTATGYCCSLSSFNGHATSNPDGTFNCTATCGTIIASLPPPKFGSSVGQAGGPPLTQTVSPAAHATSYTFGTPISDTSPYTVSIDTQPSNPAQVCTLANATGTVSGANVTNVDVTCTTATHTVTATAGPNGSASPPSQSVDDGGTAIVTLAPNAGFTASASGCGGSLGGDGVTYTTGAITADCTVAATFTPIPKSPTTTTLSLSPNPGLTNQPVTASVTVSNNALPSGTAAVADGSKSAAVIAAATPSGSVGISGGGQSCNAALVNGSGNCTLVYATPGTYTIIATYPGDAQNQPSSATAPLAVVAPVPAVPSPTLDDIALVALGLAVLALTWRRRSTGR